MINIFEKILDRVSNLSMRLLNSRLRSEFATIKHEFEEHLQAINENTNEIASNYEYTCELESKLDKLSERVEQIQMYLSESGVQISKATKFDVKRLNRREQEVFLIIYTLEEEKGSVTYSDIAAKLNISEHLASSYVASLIEKGVPIMKRYIYSKPHLRLDPEFKTLQTKENILQLSLQEFGF